MQFDFQVVSLGLQALDINLAHDFVFKILDGDGFEDGVTVGWHAEYLMQIRGQTQRLSGDIVSCQEWDQAVGSEARAEYRHHIRCLSGFGNIHPCSSC